VGKTLKLSIDRDGFRPVSRETTLTSGQPQVLSFTLDPVPGTSAGRSNP